ncbi:hypothetical protein [uncultured Methanolobus sp.]|uniref:hypothetical protein n=1 Tax=uncultured Methanolobus sp. TaxID=218300 RepID=UPI002AAA71B0|nr:hypothetical protein [uncultured Methanolobus sp.]
MKISIILLSLVLLVSSAMREKQQITDLMSSINVPETGALVTISNAIDNYNVWIHSQLM